MLRALVVVIVAVLGLVGFGMAWLARQRRTETVVLGCAGLACCSLAVATAIYPVEWLVWLTGGVALLGVLGSVWTWLMLSSITRHFDAMQVRHAVLGKTFSMSSAARVFDVAGLQLRLAALEAPTADTGSAALTITVSGVTRRVLMRKGPATASDSTEVGDYRVQLVDVSAARGNKVALVTAQLRVTRSAAP